MDAPTHRRPSLIMAILPIALTVALLLWQVVLKGGSPHIPLIFGVCITAVIGRLHGFKWAEMEHGMVHAIATSLPVVAMLMLVGMIVGTWILCGTVPYLVAWSLTVLSAQMFLPLTCLICVVISMAMGTSWGTMGTMGLALMGVGAGLGIPPYMTAGAVVSGAYFGDKMSPLSDSTNFTAAICNANLYRHIRNMMPATVPALLVSLVAYWVMATHYVKAEPDEAMIASILAIVRARFHLSPLVLLPPLVVVLMAFKRQPTLPGLFAGLVTGAVIAVLVQGAAFAQVFDAMLNGYKSATGVKIVDTLFSKGGLESMMSVNALILIALAFGGLLERVGSTEVILQAILRRVRSQAGIFVTTFLSALGLNAVSDPFVAFTIPGRMFSPVARGRGLSTTNVARFLEDGGTLGAPLIPWSQNGIYCSTMLGVPTILYAPFAVFCWVTPIIDLVISTTGLFAPRATPEEIAEWRRDGEEAVIGGRLVLIGSDTPIPTPMRGRTVPAMQNA